MGSMKIRLIFHISKVATTKDMFDILKNLFEHDSTRRSIALRTQLHTIKMKRLESVDSYFTRVAEIRDQLGNAGEQVPKKDLFIYILHGLLNAWESFVKV